MPDSYRDSPECVKCRSYDMRLQWKTDLRGHEYLEVTCRKCGYTWEMETADANKAEGK